MWIQARRGTLNINVDRCSCLYVNQSDLTDCRIYADVGGENEGLPFAKYESRERAERELATLMKCIEGDGAGGLYIMPLGATQET